MKTICLTLFVTLCGFGFSQTAPLKVRVIDYKNQPYAQDKISFYGLTKKDTYSGITNEKGEFQIQVPVGQTYEIRIQSIGDEISYQKMDLPALKSGEYYTLNTVTIQYEAGMEFTISNLNFETNKAVIQSASLPMLNNLVEIMKRKQTMRIEIDGHTDSDGDDQANLVLSEQRAQAVKAYLIQQGISATRIQTKGYGETKPVAPNTTALGKAQNRRTEILILK